MRGRIWLILWLMAVAFTVNACAGRKINTEPKPPEKQEDPVKLDVYPRIATASPRTAGVRLTVIVDPNPKNVYLEWSWDSNEGDAGLSGRTIDGNSQKKFQVFIQLTPGNYEIRATVYRSDDKSFTAKSTVNVVGMGVSPF